MLDWHDQRGRKTLPSISIDSSCLFEVPASLPQQGAVGPVQTPVPAICLWLESGNYEMPGLVIFTRPTALAKKATIEQHVRSLRV
jgi:hypothetical protein